MGYSVSAEAAQAGTAMANIVNKAHTILHAIGPELN
jgi:hypothetical protein